MSESLYTKQVQGISGAIKAVVEQGDAALRTEFAEDLRQLTSVKYGLAAELDLAAQSVQILQRQSGAITEQAKQIATSPKSARQVVPSPKPAAAAQAKREKDQAEQL